MSIAKGTFRRTQSWYAKYCLLALGIAGFLLIFFLFLQPRNSYVGIVTFEIDLPFLLTLFVGTAILACLIPDKLSSPVDYFVTIYSTVVPLSCLLFGCAVPQGDLYRRFALFVILIIPAAAAKLCLKIVPLPKGGVRSIEPKFLMYGVLVCCLFALWLGMGFQFNQLEFSWSSQYERRVAGRQMEALPAYSLAILGNGLAPLLGFLAGFQHNLICFLFAFSIPVTMFGLLGIKSQFLLIIISLALGFSFQSRVVYSGKTVLAYVALLPWAACIEVLLSGYSYIADYFIRRIFLVAAQIQMYFFDLFLSGERVSQNITYRIGKQYMGNPLTNANTNTFLLTLGENGLVGFFSSIVLSIGLLFLLEQQWNHKRNPIFLFVAFSFSFLVIEQKITTVLVSSGISVVVLLSLFCGRLDSKMDKSKQQDLQQNQL